MTQPFAPSAQAFARLLEVMAALRDPQTGCPWDLEQSFETLKAYLIEESYETLDAIDRLGPVAAALPGQPAQVDPAGPAALREELGDVLLQVVFQARIAQERGWFDAGDVARGIADKMVHRHPHVFGQAEPEGGARDLEPQDEARLTPGQVVERWEDLKRREGRGALAGVPRKLPALLRAQRVGEKAAATGFDWARAEQVFDKVEEELGELREAVASGDKAAMRHELGDLLFALTSLARHLDIDAENALRGTLDRFADRFAHVEERLAAQGRRSASIDHLEALWQQAKKIEASGAGDVAPAGDRQAELAAQGRLQPKADGGRTGS